MKDLKPYKTKAEVIRTCTSSLSCILSALTLALVLLR